MWEGSPWGSWNQGPRVFVALFTGLPFQGNKAPFDPPFFPTKSHLFGSLPPSMCSAEIFTALTRAFFYEGSKIIALILLWISFWIYLLVVASTLQWRLKNTSLVSKLFNKLFKHILEDFFLLSAMVCVSWDLLSSCVLFLATYLQRGKLPCSQCWTCGNSVVFSSNTLCLQIRRDTDSSLARKLLAPLSLWQIDQFILIAGNGC